jgi:hypothetical protein
MEPKIPDSTEDSGSLPESDPNSPILDLVGLAALLRISPASIPSLRSRTPERLPPPFFNRPLRWRREGVLRWMERKEQAEVERIERELGRVVARRR